jgi:hypothetical protein
MTHRRSAFASVALCQVKLSGAKHVRFGSLLFDWWKNLKVFEINKNELVKNKHFKNKYINKYCIIYLHNM